MALHLIKLCVGVDHVDQLRDFQRQRLAEKKAQDVPQEIMHVTRMTPKRGAEILDGGSLYWVIKRVVTARQRILELRPVTDRAGKRRCAIVLDPDIVLTKPQSRRPFQGWRYFEDKDAPADLPKGTHIDTSELSPEMKAELLELGLI